MLRDLRRNEGRGGWGIKVGVDWLRGDGGKEAPQWRTVPLSASYNDCQLFLVDVEVSEEVEGRTEGPARLHVVHLLGQLLNRLRGGSPSEPHRNMFSYNWSHANFSVLISSLALGLTCSTVFSLKPKPSFSRQVMYVMSMQRKGLMAPYLVILLHTERKQRSHYYNHENNFLDQKLLSDN